MPETPPNLEEHPVRGWGIDRNLEQRPGVPMERPPAPDPGAHWTRPPPQEANASVLARAFLHGLTPVFGTAQPLHGASGLLRRLAYRIPDHKPERFQILLFADRVDALEHRPVLLSAIAVGLVAGGFGIVQLLRSRRRTASPFTRFIRALT